MSRYETSNGLVDLIDTARSVHGHRTTFNRDSFRQTRLSLGFSMTEVAAAIGCEALAVQQWEVGRSRPQARLLPAAERVQAFMESAGDSDGGR